MPMVMYIFQERCFTKWRFGLVGWSEVGRLGIVLWVVSPSPGRGCRKGIGGTYM
jgi:hypothetical protein